MANWRRAVGPYPSDLLGAVAQLSALASLSAARCSASPGFGDLNSLFGSFTLAHARESGPALSFAEPSFRCSFGGVHGRSVVFALSAFEFFHVLRCAALVAELRTGGVCFRWWVDVRELLMLEGVCVRVNMSGVQSVRKREEDRVWVGAIGDSAWSVVQEKGVWSGAEESRVWVMVREG